MNDKVAMAAPSLSAVEAVVMNGDLSKLDPAGRLAYYGKLCERLQIDPMTQPFDWLTLNGKLVLYAKRAAAEQLRKVHGVSVEITSREMLADKELYVVTARARVEPRDAPPRCDESVGAVSVAGLKGEALANALMKCETKAKRRVTLSICGLGMLDETETETIPGAKAAQFQVAEKAAGRPQDAPITEEAAVLRRISGCLTEAGLKAVVEELRLLGPLPEGFVTAVKAKLEEIKALGQAIPASAPLPAHPTSGTPIVATTASALEERPPEKPKARLSVAGGKSVMQLSGPIQKIIEKAAPRTPEENERVIRALEVVLGTETWETRIKDAGGERIANGLGLGKDGLADLASALIDEATRKP